MDLPALQLPVSSPNMVHASQERWPVLRGAEEGLATSDAGFGDSGIGNSMSSPVAREHNTN
jgi:hypothetical protein